MGNGNGNGHDLSTVYGFWNGFHGVEQWARMGLFCVFDSGV